MGRPRPGPQVEVDAQWSGRRWGQQRKNKQRPSCLSKGEEGAAGLAAHSAAAGLRAGDCVNEPSAQVRPGSPLVIQQGVRGVTGTCAGRELHSREKFLVSTTEELSELLLARGKAAGTAARGWTETSQNTLEMHPPLPSQIPDASQILGSPPYMLQSWWLVESLHIAVWSQSWHTAWEGIGTRRVPIAAIMTTQAQLAVFFLRGLARIAFRSSRYSAYRPEVLGVAFTMSSFFL